MANITNPQVVDFCNSKIRQSADLMERTRRTLEQLLIEFTPILAIIGTDGQGNANSDPIIDGAADDGRSIITKQNLLEIKYVAEQAVTCLNQDDRETLVANVSVNGQPLF